MASNRGTFDCCRHLFRLIKSWLKDHVMSIFKLTPSYKVNLIGVISLFICYWPSPMTMDAVSATIVAGGQAQFQYNIEVNINILISTLV